ncbi:MAG: hypothetical protein IID39_08980 [Planctomycetes bacterium]|nr:hypothetical protein [Planctomycetota bacterium]
MIRIPTIQSTGQCRALERSRAPDLTLREEELGAIIDAYNDVTEKLKHSHELLTSEVRRLREQLEEKDRELERQERLAALGEMAAGVAHEVRNPLAGILLWAGLLERDLAEQPALRGLAEKIAGASRRLDDIVGDILTFAGKAEPRFEQVDLTNVLTDVLDVLKPRADATGCTVEYEAGGEALVVEADATQVQRAILNIVSNAIDAAQDGGHVWVSTSIVPVASPLVGDERAGRAAHKGRRYIGVSGTSTASFVRVQVADDGPGVADDLIHRIFDPFFTTKDSGTGLGLAIVYRIAESHGGRVTVGRRDGGGAVFALLLPVVRSKVKGPKVPVVGDPSTFNL